MEKDSQIERAMEVLRRGGVIAYANDTVYSLGAAISNQSAVRRVYQLKGRSFRRPLLIAVADFEMLARYCQVSKKDITALRKIWPSGISVLLPKRETVSYLVTAGESLVGVRMPKYPLVLAMIKKLGQPITTTSANPSGRPDVTRAEDIDLPVDLVVGGACRWGQPSTVVNLQSRQVLRRGAEFERAEKWLKSLPIKT